jgi:HK97 family phage major capsid protein
MKTVEQLRATIAAIGAEARPLVEKSKAGELTQEEDVKYDELVADLNAAMQELVDAEKRQARDDQMTQTAERFIKPASQSEQRALANEQTEEFKTLGQRFTTSEAYTDYLKHPAGTSAKFRPDNLLSMAPAEEKALIYSGTPSASVLLPQVLPGIRRGNEPISAVRAALGSGRTTSDNVTVLQENVFTNAAVEVAEATATNEGAKPESAITFTEVTFPVRTVAHWIPITRQTLEDLPMMESYVDQRLRDGLERRIDNQLINGDGTAPNISGLLDQSGLTTADAAYFAANAVNDAGTDNENLNRIRRAKRLVMTTGDATATFILANPADAEDWDTLSTTTGEYLVGDPTSGAGISRLWGLPVYEDENIAAGTAIVGDGTQAAVIDRMDAAVYMSDSHSDFFIRNIFVLLAEALLTLVVFRPAAFVVTTLA